MLIEFLEKNNIPFAGNNGIRLGINKKHLSLVPTKLYKKSVVISENIVYIYY